MEVFASNMAHLHCKNTPALWKKIYPIPSYSLLRTYLWIHMKQAMLINPKLISIQQLSIFFVAHLQTIPYIAGIFLVPELKPMVLWWIWRIFLGHSQQNKDSDHPLFIFKGFRREGRITVPWFAIGFADVRRGDEDGRDRKIHDVPGYLEAS